MPHLSLKSNIAKASVWGATIGFLLIVSAIMLSTHNYLAFFSLEGLMIVGGGVIAVAYMSFQESDVNKALHSIRMMFREPHVSHESLPYDMKQIIEWARIVKERGMRGLEITIGKTSIQDPFVKYGLHMVVSHYTPDEVRAMMETAADAYYERDSIPADVLQTMASHAPAFGMVGTLVGMVTMLCSLSENVSSIGASLAVSFLSTLYGVISARMIYMPAASKLRQKIESLRFRNQLITEGMVMLVSDKSPNYIQDRLNSFLRPEVHNYLNIVSTQNSSAATIQHQLKTLGRI